MQLINNANEEINNYLLSNDTLIINQDTLSDNNYADLFDFIDKLKLCTGLIIEICGTWLWVGGNTITHKELLKELKFKYSGSKKAWYFSNNLTATKKRGFTNDINTIRNKYGSKVISTTAQTRISA
jgi:hypothetical protein